MEEHTESNIREATPQACSIRFRQRYENRLAALAASVNRDDCAPADSRAATSPAQDEQAAEFPPAPADGGTDVSAQQDPGREIERFTSLFSQAYVAARHAPLQTRARGSMLLRQSRA